MKSIGIFILSMFALFSCQNSSKQTTSEACEKKEKTSCDTANKECKAYEIGSEVKDFNLKNVDETYISFDSYPDAKGFVVIFSCNHCPYVVTYEDRMIELHNKYAPLGYPVIAINPNDPEVVAGDSFEKMQERATEKQFPFAYLVDEGQKVYPKFGATRTPHIFIINKENDKKILRYIGAIDNNYEDASAVTEKYVEDALNSLLEGAEIETTITKAVGCTIKTKNK